MPPGGSRRPPSEVRHVPPVLRLRYAAVTKGTYVDILTATTAELLAAGHLYANPPAPKWASRFLAAGGQLMLIARVGGAPAGFVSGIETPHPDKGAEMFGGPS